jgi:MinD-like ATPase involved in chromosome partitioning or flagellar assembly
MKKLMFLIMGATLLLGACGANEGSSRLALMNKTNPDPVHTADNGSKVSEKSVEKDVEALPELYDVAVIKGKKDFLVAYKVKHLQRFRMKDIEKKLADKLEKKYPNENFTVSSDYKIFLEATRLQERIKSGKYNEKAAEKRLQEIIELQKEKT